ncbi:hypothetical protein [Sulfitobacter noctilucicola]|uniref:L-lactate utilization protein LutB n=1 Tax=Sulfitobacter noctilucicola TaxID=1342301 RepID=A0A7W6M6T0_9RHOB|nr:hypothetical protein [Sulfitobacter noctilucicola]MBB4173429.1 L-lactate utilization protein LutB [Sulfitobacter noctilucicola]
MRFLIVAGVLCTASAASAQPYSESMADCASVYQNAAQWVRTDESADKLMQAAIQWAEAAVRQSEIEGKPTSIDAVWDRIDVKTDAWEQKGSGVFFSEDFRDWTQYCRKFAKHTKVRINP